MKKILVLTLLLVGVIAVEVMAQSVQERCMKQFGNATTCSIKIQKGEFK